MAVFKGSGHLYAAAYREARPMTVYNATMTAIQAHSHFKITETKTITEISQLK